jgi:hypothetical protein
MTAHDLERLQRPGEVADAARVSNLMLRIIRLPGDELRGQVRAMLDPPLEPQQRRRLAEALRHAATEINDLADELDPEASQ